MNLSASKRGLLDFCKWFARPEVHSPRGEQTAQQRGGTGLHALVDAHFVALIGGRPPPIAEAFTEGMPPGQAAETIELFEAFLRDPFSRIPWVTERAFAYDPATDTARMLPVNVKCARCDGSGDQPGEFDPADAGCDACMGTGVIPRGPRDYSDRRPGEIMGTPDAHLYEPAVRTVHVGDWKRGEGNEAREILSNGQGEHNALATARAFDATTAVATEVDFTPDGPKIRQRTFDAEQLDAIALRLADQLALIPDSEPTPGPHCTEMWCPAQAMCPATSRYQMALVPGPALEFQIDSPDQLAFGLHRIAVIRSACDVYEAQANRYVDDHGGSIALPDGRKYGRFETHPRSLDMSVPDAPPLLVELGYRDAATITVSKAALERVARARGLVGKAVDDEIDRVFARMGAIGAVGQSTTVTYTIKGKRHSASSRRPETRQPKVRDIGPAVVVADSASLPPAIEPRSVRPPTAPSPVDGVEF